MGAFVMAPALRVSLGTGKGARVSCPLRKKSGVARAAPRVSRTPAAPMKFVPHVAAARKRSGVVPSKTVAVVPTTSRSRYRTAKPRRVALAAGHARAQDGPKVRPVVARALDGPKVRPVVARPAAQVRSADDAVSDAPSTEAPRDTLEFDTHGARRSALSAKRAVALWDDLPPLARLGPLGGAAARRQVPSAAAQRSLVLQRYRAKGGPDGGAIQKAHRA